MANCGFAYSCMKSVFVCLCWCVRHAEGCHSVGVTTQNTELCIEAFWECVCISSNWNINKHDVSLLFKIKHLHCLQHAPQQYNKHVLVVLQGVVTNSSTHVMCVTLTNTIFTILDNCMLTTVVLVRPHLLSSRVCTHGNRRVHVVVVVGGLCVDEEVTADYMQFWKKSHSTPLRLFPTYMGNLS